MIKEAYILLLSKTDILVYCIICVLQISCSSVLALPISLFVYLCGTLTSPRPSKAFWVILIAYAQLSVIIKSMSHFNLWWNENHFWIRIFGIRPSDSIAIYELLLIVAIAFHRAVLKVMGLWQPKERSEFKFHEGEFFIKSCDSDTSILIEKCLKERKSVVKEVSEERSTTNSFVSMDPLIIDEDREKEKVLSKHELTKDKLSVVEVYENRRKLLKVREHLECEVEGGFIINLQQDERELTLRAINLLDFSKTIHTNKLVTVDNIIEEPFDFFPSAIWMSIQRHFFITRSFVNLVKSKPTTKRVDVYKFMFFCDLVNFLVLLIGFKEFVVSVDTF